MKSNHTLEVVPSEHPSDPWRDASSRAGHPSARMGDERLVASIAAGLAKVSVPWEMATGSHPAERAYELLLSTDLYDAWLIYWPPGTGLDAHDHGGAEGAFAVVSGHLDEDVANTARPGKVMTRQLGPGALVSFGSEHVHSVINRGDTGATSVHVYSPPLKSMSFYSADVNGELVMNHTDAVAEARR